MKKKLASKSAFFNPRVLITFAFCAIGVLLALGVAWSASSVAPPVTSNVNLNKNEPSQPIQAPNALLAIQHQLVHPAGRPGRSENSAPQIPGKIPAKAHRLDTDDARRFAKLSPNGAGAFQATQLSLAERVAYQRAIEEVYWRHRIWPKERPDPKPLLDEVMPPAQLAQKVEDYLRNSQALEDYWQEPVRAEQLQAEMERMA